MKPLFITVALFISGVTIGQVRQLEDWQEGTEEMSNYESSFSQKCSWQITQEGMINTSNTYREPQKALITDPMGTIIRELNFEPGKHQLDAQLSNGLYFVLMNDKKKSIVISN